MQHLNSAMTDSPGGNAADRFRQLPLPSAGVDQAGRFQIGVACEAAKRALRAATKGMVEDAAGLPNLTSMSCDGTPMQTTFHRQYCVGGRQFRSVWKASHELLVKSEFLRSFLHGEG